jgi:hypothetical protein
VSAVYHPMLKVLTAPVYTTDHDFADLAQADTILGTVYFTRMQDGWQWSLEVEYRAPDDNTCMTCDSHNRTLDQAVMRADILLKGLLEKARR